MAATQFELDGRSFKLSPLGVEAQLRALTLLAPIMAGLAKGGNVADSLASLANLTPLFKLFAGSTKVDGVRGEADKAFVDLPAFADSVFERKPTLLLAYLAECVRIELGDFLAASGQARLASIVSRFSSPTASTGGSGE